MHRRYNFASGVEDSVAAYKKRSADDCAPATMSRNIFIEEKQGYQRNTQKTSYASQPRAKPSSLV